ncbi:unnamed protein product [Adineta steineri]|uniref:RWD domain-containing protein n=2 Tax=Adineta steineri TaxID=433720 RepID=A0A815FCW6_9BILA|nr:unnamed protein product [Adineta steineri]CAF1326882.1 unnamed protein product [Adineta steineri]
MTTLINCQELQREEIESLEMIFGSAWSKYDENSETYRLALERNSEQRIELQVTFIDGYPVHNPPKYSIFAPWLKGTKRQKLMNELENVIKQYNNEPVVYRLAQTIYDFLDEKIVFLNDEQHDNLTKDKSNDTCEIDYVKYSKRLSVPQLSPEEKYSCPEIFTDEPNEEDRASVFQAHCARIEHECQVQMVLDELKKHKKIATAKHNVYAYRVNTETGKIINECNDDGENRAGEWVLEPLVFNNLNNIMVVVTRWHRDYSIHMGAGRFTAYKQCCAEIIKKFLK